MQFTSKAKVCGIVANPVEHSLSPLMQNAFAEYYQKDFVYVPFHVRENLGVAIRGAYAMNLTGMNITIPYKVDVMDYLIEVDEVAKKIGAVNTLVRVESGFKGYNTDMDGLRFSLARNGIDLSGRHVLILGAGGVSKAVLYLCRLLGAASITMVHRNVEKANAMLHEMWIEGEVLDLEAVNANPLQALSHEHYIAFQCTGIGMHPNISECVITNSAFFEKIDAGIDVIYTPLCTQFMKKCMEHGKKAVNGLDMLIYQGLLAFLHWNPDIILQEKVVDLVRGRLLDTLQ